jgi:hypothetical protein
MRVFVGSIRIFIRYEEGIMPPKRDSKRQPLERAGHYRGKPGSAERHSRAQPLDRFASAKQKGSDLKAQLAAAIDTQKNLARSCRSS